jgi:hypothetical protein
MGVAPVGPCRLARQVKKFARLEAAVLGARRPLPACRQVKQFARSGSCSFLIEAGTRDFGEQDMLARLGLVAEKLLHLPASRPGSR